MIVGCRRETTSSAGGVPGQVTRSAIATVYPLADVVRQVAGDRANVLWNIQWFCEGGLDPRELRLTEEQARLATRVDLLVTSGLGDRWAGQSLSDAERDRRLLNPATATAAGLAYASPHGALWLDVSLVRQLVDPIRQRLTLIDPKHEGDYRRSAAECAKTLADLDERLGARLGPLRGRAFVALRPTWGPMVQRFGIQEIVPVDTDPQHLGDDDVRTLRRAAADHHTDLLAIDGALLPGVQRDLQRRTGLRLLALDLVGTSAPDGHSTYVRIMEYNMGQLVEGLK